MRISAAVLSLLLTVTVVACGGGGGGEEGAMEEDTMAMSEPTDETTAETGAGTLSTPTWMQIDEAGRTVTMDLRAGESDVNNRWNYNGLYAQSGRVVVPQGYQVTINFTNSDPTQPHSLGIDEQMTTWPATFENIEPVFAGAITPDAATTGTPAGGGTATITFTADQVGQYAMVCYIAGHAVAGMVVPFEVSGEGSVGIEQ